MLIQAIIFIHMQTQMNDFIKCTSIWQMSHNTTVIKFYIIFKLFAIMTPELKKRNACASPVDNELTNTLLWNIKYVSHIYFLLKWHDIKHNEIKQNIMI